MAPAALLLVEARRLPLRRAISFRIERGHQQLAIRCKFKGENVLGISRPIGEQAKSRRSRP
jgi:hypothetical protein